MAARADRRRQAEPLAAEIGEALLAAASGDGLIAVGRDRRIVYCNTAGAVFLRLPRMRAAGSDLTRLAARLGDETLELRFLSALRDRTPVEFVVARPGGDDEWVEVRGLPTPSGMAFFLREVTERERSERELRRKERRLRSASDSLRMAHQAARAATWEWRAGDRLRWLDIAAARALIGLPAHAQADEAIADWRSFVVEDDLPNVAEALRRLATAEETSFEFRVAGADGHYWLRASAAVIERRPDGGPARVAGVTLDVTPHKLAEAKLQREIAERVRAEQRQQLLIYELNPRVKNMLATVQSVARQSLGRASGGGPLADFEDRLMALAWTHDILTKERWIGASLSTILRRTLAPHASAARVDLEGPDLRVSPKMALALAMGVHELATNAVKYGALSNDQGRVKVRWALDDGRLTLTWHERGGPRVTLPATRGFGSRLLERGLANELGGEVEMRFEPSGLRCRITAPFQAETSEDAAEVMSAAMAGQAAVRH
jgi:two-component sensor histidine kinase